MIRKYINLLFPKYFYDAIKNFYKSKFKKPYKIDKKKLEDNLEKLKSLNFDEKEIKKILEESGYSFFNTNLSWHYHIFAGLKSYALKNSISYSNILEIGTYKGEFTNFISSLFSNSNIYTIDLEKGDQEYLTTYYRQDKDQLREFIFKRDRNLKRSNINFQEINSTKLINYFKDLKFDLIWIDGDHLYPQVTIDIINSINLIKEDGIICIDDVVKDKKFLKSQYKSRNKGMVSTDSFSTINLLEKNKIITNIYLNKRIRKCNHKTEKYIAISKLNNKFNS